MADDPLVPVWLSQLLTTAKPPPQTLDALEVFCGQGQLLRALRHYGLNAEGFDHRNSLGQDICTLHGFLLLCLLVLSVAEGGLVWFAPPCSSWAFLSHSSHKRLSLNNFHGNLESNAVLQANHLACWVSAFIRLAISRGLEVVVEQPTDSCLFKFPAMAKAVSTFGGLSVQTYLGSFCDSFPCPKPLHLKSSNRWILDLYRNKPFDLQANSGVYTRGPGNSVTGGPDLANTAAYPFEFGLAALTLYLFFFLKAATRSVCFYQTVAEVAASFLREKGSSCRAREISATANRWPNVASSSEPDETVFSWLRFH